MNYQLIIIILYHDYHIITLYYDIIIFHRKYVLLFSLSNHYLKLKNATLKKITHEFEISKEEKNIHLK